jgi:hypothetical protein
MPLDVHLLFNGSKRADYLSNLTVAQATETTLRDARDEIRDAIRVGLRDWDKSVAKSVLFEDALANVPPPSLRPKFRMQGSFSYRTCNLPAKSPPQEIDLDDGLFLPVSFLTGNGAHYPVVVSQGLFLAVEKILDRLCASKGWKLDKSKNSCVRVRLGDGAHIDLALYAMPDAAYAELLEKAARSRGRLVADQLSEAREFADEFYRELPGDQIMLAHRKEGWKPSDPRKLEDWFREAVKRHSEQLRRVSRYFKGWRDYQWDICQLASIALMSAVVTAYDEAEDAVPEDRDDLAILMVAERLPQILSGLIANPVVDGQRLDEGWAPEQRAGFVTAAEALLQCIQGALTGTDDAEAAIDSLIEVFGPRIPDDTDLVRTETMPAPSVKSAIGAPAILRSSHEQMTASIAALDDAERYARAEAAAREVEVRGSASKPWSRR